MSEMNNTLGGVNNRIDIAEGKVSGLEGLAVEAIQSETEKTRLKISEQHSFLLCCSLILSLVFSQTQLIQILHRTKRKF